MENLESLYLMKSASFATYASISSITANFSKELFQAFYTKQNLISFLDEKLQSSHNSSLLIFF